MAYANVTHNTMQTNAAVPSVEVRNNTDIEISKILYRVLDYLYLIVIVALI